MWKGAKLLLTNTFDDLGRETSTWLINSGGVTLDYSDYAYNEANQRTGSVRKGGDAVSSVGYTYDPIGQLTSDLAKEIGSGTLRLNEQLRYAYDAAGNLKTRTNNTLVQSFGVNSLNQLTTSGNTGKLTVIGATSSKATSVTVNTTNAILYADNTYAATNMPITSSYTAVAQDAFGRQDTTSISVNLPASVSYLYDGNGNLTNDGVRSFAYDAENQLIQVIGTNGTARYKSDFAYDGKMRRRVRTEATWTGSAWATNQTIRYVYDGNLVIQERDGNNVAIVSYARGKDLSGSLEGAGGIGGLLARKDLSSGTLAYYHCDGNGNVTALADGTQTVVARYLYDAFGNLIAKSGSMADTNLYRFSSKEFHQNSGLVYYLYRYYDSNLQRWPNRDPLEEDYEDTRGLDLYCFVDNNPVSRFDYFGLSSDDGGKGGRINEHRKKRPSCYDKHTKAQGRPKGGSRPGKIKPNMAQNKCNCPGNFATFALYLSICEFVDSPNCPPLPDEDHECPLGYIPKRHDLPFGFYWYECVPGA